MIPAAFDYHAPASLPEAIALLSRYRDSAKVLSGGQSLLPPLKRSELIKARYPILLDTAKVIADPLVRNRATVGGNLAHGDPGNDHPATMIALRAQVVAQGPKGERVIPIDQFFL